MNSDCTANLACVRSKCQDPCPGACGPNAMCNAVNHLPVCICIQGYTGDPFRYCNLNPIKRKDYIYFLRNSNVDVDVDIKEKSKNGIFLLNFIKYHVEYISSMKFLKIFYAI